MSGSRPRRAIQAQSAANKGAAMMSAAESTEVNHWVGIVLPDHSMPRDGKRMMADTPW